MISPWRRLTQIMTPGKMDIGALQYLCLSATSFSHIMAADAVKAAEAASETKETKVDAAGIGNEMSKMMESPVKILGLSGSLRKASANTGLLRVAETAAKSLDGIDFEIVRYDDIPMFNSDLEGDEQSGDPKAVQELWNKIKAADALLFATTEYNYGVSAPLKNAIDWASRRGNAFKGKCASMVGGGGGAKTFKSQYALRQIAVFLELKFITKPEMGMYLWEKRDDKPVVNFVTGDLINEQLKERVVAQVVALRDFTKKQKMGEAAFKLLSTQ